MVTFFSDSNLEFGNNCLFSTTRGDIADIAAIFGKGDLRANGTRTGAVYANECGQAGFVTLSMPIREARENIVFKHKFIKACFVKMDNIIRQDEASRICLTDNLGGL